MANTTTEILMQFIGQDQRAIKAECMTDIDDSDALANLDVAGYAKAFEAGRYFLVDSFKFGITLNDSESQAKNPQQDVAVKALLASAKPDMQKQLQKHLQTLNAASAGQSFSRWRSAEDWQAQSGNAPPYTAKIDDFSFTRRVDVASTVLFFYCFKQQSFPFASLIKRKSAPIPDSDAPENQAYLRLDFADVQISNLQWSDDDVVEETCMFRAKKMRAQYWMQQTLGSATDAYLASLNSAEWTNTAAK